MATSRPATPDRRSARQAGSSSIELVFYMPILMLIVFLVVQFSVIALANQVASGAAREAARVARAGGGDAVSLAAAETAGVAYANRIGGGMLAGVQVDVAVSGPLEVTAAVSGTAVTIVPRFGGAVDVSVTGPVEDFRPDG